MITDYRSLRDLDSHIGASAVQVCAESTGTVGRVESGFDANTTLSVIIRSHKKERLPFLDEALFSLAIQHWHDLETIVVLENRTDEWMSAVIDLIERQPWPVPPRYKVLSVEVPEGVDRRAAKINHGVANASGRYLAFLDDDDVVYQHGYATLIGQLIAGGRAVAVGGCRAAQTESESGHQFVKTKASPFRGRTRLELFRENFIPINSYVIDRARTGAFDLSFDDEMLLDDYDFLLRLCAAFEPDFSKLETPVCEYRFHDANTVPYKLAGTELVLTPGPTLDKISRSMEKILEKKKQYTCVLSLSELAEYAEISAGLQYQIEQLQARLEQEQRHAQQLQHGLQLERARLTYRAVRAMTDFLDKHAGLVKPVGKLLRRSLKIVRR